MRVPPAALRYLLLLVALYFSLGASCREHTVTRAAPPFPDSALWSWSGRGVGQALARAEQAAAEALRSTVHRRYRWVSDYVESMTETMEAVRETLPETASHGIAGSRALVEALDRADRATDELMRELPALGWSWRPVLQLGGAYLDGCEAAVEALVGGEPQSDYPAFVDRYQSRIELFNRWASATGAVVDAFNRGGAHSALEPSIVGDPADALALSAADWSRTLRDTCEAGLSGEIPGRRELKVNYRLAASMDLGPGAMDRDDEGARDGVNGCRGAVSALFADFRACSDAIQRAGGQRAERGVRRAMGRAMRDGVRIVDEACGGGLGE